MIPFSNNPGDIREANIGYTGKQPANGSAFMSFDTMAHGFRAMFVLLYTYVKQGTDTLSAIINKYAPPGDNNDTSAYLSDVSNKTGMAPTQMIIAASFAQGGPMVDVVRAMAQHENSPSGSWSEDDLQQGYQQFLTDYGSQLT